jgi:hypothetical protein
MHFLVYGHAMSRSTVCFDMTSSLQDPCLRAERRMSLLYISYSASGRQLESDEALAKRA